MKQGSIFRNKRSSIISQYAKLVTTINQIKIKYLDSKRTCTNFQVFAQNEHLLHIETGETGPDIKWAEKTF